VAESDFAPRAPLAGLLPSGRHGVAEGPAGLRLAECAFLATASIAVRAGQGAELAARLAATHGVALPPRPGCAEAGPVTLVWTGPGQWLALRAGLDGAARFGFARDLATGLAGVASVTDLTGARAVLRLSGPAAVAVLRKLVPIDVEEESFPLGAAAVTLTGHIGVTLWRAADGYRIACYRSFGGSLAHAVLEAAAEFGCDVADVS
jgi:sarcosine oxidase subunit gamma